MLRFVLFIIAFILIVPLLRSVLGLLARGFGDLVGGSRTPARQDAPPGGELKKDPVCGTYVAAGSSVKKTIGGQEVWFCSAECRDRYRG